MPEVPELVDALLADAVRRRASDVHLEPVEAGYEARLRVDGILHTHQPLDEPTGRSMVLRLMVLARLLTYRLDIPQEGRAEVNIESRPLDLRVSMIPTARGLRATVRLPAELLQPRKLEQLGLDDAVLAGLRAFAKADSGLLLLLGPAGSGKTTTLYALLEYIAQQSRGLSIISIEDPVERRLDGVTQIEVSRFGDLSYAATLKSLLRQDPQVLMLGEIRDTETASLAMQAALSGHRLLSTFHASDAAGAVGRLLEMGIAPYQVSACVFGIVSQRLLRRKTDNGYQGRIPIAQFVYVDEPIRQLLGQKPDIAELRSAFERQNQDASLRRSAQRLVESGLTDLSEVQRVLGE